MHEHTICIPEVEHGEDERLALEAMHKAGAVDMHVFCRDFECSESILVRYSLPDDIDVRTFARRYRDAGGM
jgi:hypothetical protein